MHAHHATFITKGTHREVIHNERELLGQGMQCVVYRCSGKRVVKYLRTEEESQNYYRLRNPEFSKPGQDYSRASAHYFVSSAAYALDCVARGVLGGCLLAFPEIAGENALFQREIEPCSTVFFKGDRVLSSKVLEEFVRINTHLWERGVFEVTMSLDKYGFLDDKLVLYDFFELGSHNTDWRMLGDVRWWRQCNAFLEPLCPGILDAMDALLLPLFQGTQLAPSTMEAPEGCRLETIKTYCETQQLPDGGYPWNL